MWSISLRNAAVEADGADPRQLKVTTPAGEIFLRAVDMAERDKWLTCLDASIRCVSAGGGGGKSVGGISSCVSGARGVSWGPNDRVRRWGWSGWYLTQLRGNCLPSPHFLTLAFSHTLQRVPREPAPCGGDAGAGPAATLAGGPPRLHRDARPRRQYGWRYRSAHPCRGIRPCGLRGGALACDHQVRVLGLSAIRLRNGFWVSCDVQQAVQQLGPKTLILRPLGPL